MRRALVAAYSVLASAIPCLALEVKGFEASHDEAMVQELARYGMNGLLDRYFQVSGATQEQQASVRAMMSIRKLLLGGQDMSPAQRQQMVREITAGAEVIVPKLHDPRQLMELAAALITNGMERTANTIEYWGENPRSQAELRPVAQTVATVLDVCEKRAREQADALVAKFGNNPSQAQVREYTSLDNLATTARYTRYMADYFRAMSLPKSDPKRASIADEAIKGLSDYDNAESRVQPVVRARIGKLQMVKGDYAAAKKSLLSVAENTDKQITPEPNVLQQYDARYFAAVVDVLSGDVAVATKAVDDLKAWQGANLPNDKAIRDGAEASFSMLQYRLETLKASVATGPDKAAAEARANAVLKDLGERRPDLRGVIYEQLVKALPEDAPVKAMDPIMLMALVQQGVAEQSKPEGETPNQATMERAIAAGQELLSRPAGAGAADPAVRDDVAIVIPQLMEKLGRDAQAAQAYLAYVQTSTNKTNRPAAMSNALAAISRLRAAKTDDAEVQKLLDVALPLAVNQFGRKDLAYDLGRRLHERGQYADAIAMYAAVPRDDTRAMVADFHRMRAMKQDMDHWEGRDAGARQKRTEEIRRLAETLARSAADARTAATNEADKNRAGLIEARARLMQATLVKESDPAQAVKALDGFEKAIQGLPGSDDLEAEALFVRIHSLMASGQKRRGDGLAAAASPEQGR